MKVKNILISQNAPADFDKSPYADLKKKYSINLDFYKFFRIEGITSREFRDAKVDLSAHNAVVFSSKNTIDHFFNLIKELRYEMPESMKYFCTTESVAFYLQKYIQFRKRKIFFPKSSNPNAVFDLFQKNKELKYLIPCSSELKTPYAEYFNQHNIECTQAVVFKNVPADLKQDVDIDKYDMLVFFSPSGIQSLQFNFPDYQQGEVYIGALGSAAAQAVENAGLQLHVIAPTPEAPSITAALDIFLKEHATRRR